MNGTKGNPLNYSFVQSDRTLELDTFRHRWILCQETGNAYSIKKKPGLIHWLLQVNQRRKQKKSSNSIYDYF
ncbi:MAG: hypothetical protein JNJ96_12880, partial [Anaerolineales bacterium]|nr:hypothetical protein [Anaerolineales bacterium]